jgi:hypothetical protein
LKLFSVQGALEEFKEKTKGRVRIGRGWMDAIASSGWCYITSFVKKG